jgi:DNA ligase-1
MRAFANLLERLTLTPARNRKIELLQHYFRDTPDPDRGLALAAITGGLDLRTVGPALIRELISQRTDAELFRLSYDYVGDLAETVALIWPGGDAPPRDRSLGEIVAALDGASRASAPGLIAELLDEMEASQRLALIKLATGGLRIGVSARLAKQALSGFGGVEVNEIEELWHGLEPPYLQLFAWLEGRGPRPAQAAAAPFRPVMLSHALEDRDREAIRPEDFMAEFKWDGIRVQAVGEAGARRLYTRTGDDISAAFPDLLAHMEFDGAIDGELLVGEPGRDLAATGSFSDLQQRLNRKSVPAALMRRHPAFLRAYDLLVDGGEDLRALPLAARKERLARFAARLDPRRFDLSPAVEWTRFSDLKRLRMSPPHPVIEGLMLKRLDSPYLPGRPKGHWYKWKKDPDTVDAVLMYAQRGHGKRSGYYSDFTFGVWRDRTGVAPPGELVPVGKAYFGFSDEELRELDRYVRENTLERFGPVRSVRAGADHGLVLEIAFEGLNRSTRHKSGVAMRFPRISRIRWDKPPAEADRLERLEAMIGLDRGDASA